MGPCIIMLQHEVMVVDEWHNNGPQDLVTVTLCIQNAINKMHLCSLSIIEIDRYIGLPIFFPIFKHFTIIQISVLKKKRYIYIFFQDITSSEMCSLHLTHPSAHTLGAVGTVHSGEAQARPPHVTFNKIYLFETH